MKNLLQIVLTMALLPSFIIGLAQKPATVKTTAKKVAPENVKAAPGAYFIYDTVKAGWTVAAPSAISFGPSLMTDNQGNIYAQVKTSEWESAYCILQNGQWKILADEIKDKVYSLFKDINGNIFAMSNWSKIYKKTGTQWNLVAGDSNYVVDIRVQAGESFYGFSKQAGSGKYALVKWTGKSWTVLETTTGILEFNGFPYVIADKKGVIYFSAKDNNKANVIQCLIGKELKELGQMPDDVKGLGLDEDGFLYAFGENMNKHFFKKWNGNNLSDVPLPPGITKYVYPDIKYYGGKIHLSALTEDPNDPPAERFYFILQKGNWKKICNYNTDFSSYLPIESKGVFYVISRKNNALLRLETGRIIKREIYPFSIAAGLSQNTEIEEIKTTYRLVKEGNKYGVINQKGHVVIYSAIDNITIDKDPMSSTFIRYAFNLFVNGENFYVPINNSKIDPFSLPGIYNEKIDKCKACNGKGRFEARKEYETVQGEWVEGYTSTTTRPSTMGGYQKTTTTTPGYRKPSTQRVKGTIASSDCSKCRGKGQFVTGWKETLEYNAFSNSYRKQRKEYTN